MADPTSEPLDEIAEVAVTGVPDPFGIDKFVAQISNNGLAKTSRFKVMINYPPAYPFDTDLLYNMCESVEFPGRGLATTDVKIYGPSFKMPVSSSFPEVTLTFLCDASLSQKTVLDGWMDVINPADSFDMEYRDNYISTIEITQANELYDPTLFFKMTLREAYPINIMPLSGNWADDGVHRVQATFTYRYYTLE